MALRVVLLDYAVFTKLRKLNYMSYCAKNGSKTTCTTNSRNPDKIDRQPGLAQFNQREPGLSSWQMSIKKLFPHDSLLRTYATSILI